MESGPESRGDARRQTTDSAGAPSRWCCRWCLRKYVSACLVCGGLSVCHGVVFVVIYLLLRSYTSSLQFFETIPTYVPGAVFIITGLILMCFAKRKNRYAFLLKVSGGCCVVSALLCVVVTVTTTVVHMNRLQTLHECVYTPQARTCMCVSAIGGEHSVQEAHRFVFQSTSSCEVVHGVLYSCLRALFSFSVLGILLCISCAMLVYQLASHEKKRTYWEQLELRRRFLYQRHSHCGCYDELYPWHLWDYLDYRLLQHSVMLPEAPPPTTTAAARQRSSWPHWLPWPSSRRSHQATEEAPPVPNGGAEWRSECIHIFRPPRTTTNGVQGAGQPGGAAAPRFGPRHHMHHRRTRSNDAVFHHLRYSHPPPPPQQYVEIPRYLWGPPPPYSQPDPRPLTNEGQIEAPPTDTTVVNPASKVSTPLSSERRFDFAIGDPTTPQKKEGDGDTCVVEVHVPYLLPQTNLQTRPRIGAFHTLPAPSVKGRRKGLFKSLSSIPTPKRGRDLEQPLLQLSVIKACCDSPPPGLGAELSDSLSYPPTLLLDAPSEFRSSGAGRCVSRPRGQSLPNLRGSSPSEVAVLFRGGVAPSLKEDSASDHSSTSRGLPDLDMDSSNSEECCDDPFGTSSSDGSAHSSSTSSPPGPVIRGEGLSRNASRHQALPPPSIILSGGRPATDCPIDCRIRHLHRYHRPDKSEEVRDSGFIVTIKSLDV